MRDFLAKLLLHVVSDVNYTRIRYFLKHGKPLNLENPETFYEKINYLKLFSNNPLRNLVVDRIKVRNYVASKSDSCGLIPLLWHGTDFTKQVYDQLPLEFVIKGNHGSKMVSVINKDKNSYEEVYAMTRKWLKRDYYARGRERVYKDLERYIIVEQKLNMNNGKIPLDFKFFCFDGKVGLIEVDIERFEAHKRNFYNRDFEQLDLICGYPNGTGVVKPSQYHKAVEIAEEISKDFSFIRVDLYLLDDNSIYFGELTNFHENGLGVFHPRSYDNYYGQKITTLY